MPLCNGTDTHVRGVPPVRRSDFGRAASNRRAQVGSAAECHIQPTLRFSHSRARSRGDNAQQATRTPCPVRRQGPACHLPHGPRRLRCRIRRLADESHARIRQKVTWPQRKRHVLDFWHCAGGVPSRTRIRDGCRQARTQNSVPRRVRVASAGEHRDGVAARRSLFRCEPIDHPYRRDRGRGARGCDTRRGAQPPSTSTWHWHLRGGGCHGGRYGADSLADRRAVRRCLQAALRTHRGRSARASLTHSVPQGEPCLRPVHQGGDVSPGVGSRPQQTLLAAGGHGVLHRGVLVTSIQLRVGTAHRRSRLGSRTRSISSHRVQWRWVSRPDRRGSSCRHHRSAPHVGGRNRPRTRRRRWFLYPIKWLGSRAGDIRGQPRSHNVDTRFRSAPL